VKLGLVKTGFPLGERHATEATRLNELNLAIKLLGYYYLRTRVVDLSRVTLRKTREPANRVAIKGYNEYTYLLDEYRSKSSGGHLLNYHTSRRTREIIKQVFVKYLVAPDWTSAINSRVLHHRITMPAISLHGDPRNLIESQQCIKVNHIATQRAIIWVRYTTFQASYSELPQYPTFLWEECEYLPTIDEDELEEKKLREENQVRETSVKTLEVTDQEFWAVSHIHLTRVDCVSETALKSLLNPRPRIRTPPPMPYVEHEDFEEEPKHLEPPERGESEWTRSTSISPRRSVCEGLQPRRSRSASAGRRHLDRSRSRSRAPPVVAPSSPPRRRGPTRRTRLAVRGQMAAAKLVHMKLQAEILANSIGQEVFDSVSTMEAVRRANPRLRQENISVAINPAED